MDIRLYNSRWKAIKLMLRCSFFVLCGLFIAIQMNPSSWAAYSIAGLFGLGYPVGIYYLLDRRPQIIINEFGVFDRTTYRDFINWDIIRSAYSIDLSGQKFVVLTVDEKFLSAVKKRRFARSISNLVDFGRPQKISISLGQVAIDEVKLSEFILAMIKLTPEDRREKLKDRLLT
jgi:hypothetical protein